MLHDSSVAAVVGTRPQAKLVDHGFPLVPCMGMGLCSTIIHDLKPTFKRGILVCSYKYRLVLRVYIYHNYFL